MLEFVAVDPRNTHRVLTALHYRLHLVTNMVRGIAARINRVAAYVLLASDNILRRVQWIGLVRKARGKRSQNVQVVILRTVVCADGR